jgi:two-component system, NarL family, invasion response regulator UvrY
MGPRTRGGPVIKILIADDHAVVRRGLREILSERDDLLVAGEASTAAEVMGKVQQERFDVIVLDIAMPGGSGIDLLGDIRRVRPEARVLVLTMFSEEQYAIRAIRAGAAGFLTKETAPEKLVEAVQRVAAGGRFISAELAEALASVVAGESKGRPHELLSNREFEILKMIGSGKTVSQIADDLGLSVKTVSTHRTRILRKMVMKTNAELTHYVVKNALVE